MVLDEAISIQVEACSKVQHVCAYEYSWNNSLS